MGSSVNGIIDMITTSGDRVFWPQQIAAIAFDMDGLLINTEELYFDVFEELMQRRGQHYTHELRRSMMGLPSPRAFEVLIEQARLKESIDQLEQECEEIFLVYCRSPGRHAGSVGVTRSYRASKIASLRGHQ